jgi:2-polyprenyl-6-methoxyphenol hydroxylase-like FAD-dependent oxidoreductase
VVVGGGIAGLATSIAIRRSGASVAVIEHGDYEDGRISEILPSETNEFLRKLSIWDAFLELKCGIAVDSRLSAWGAPPLDHIDHMFNPHGCAWLVSRPGIDRFLANIAVRRGVHLFRGAKLLRCDRENEIWRLVLRHGGLGNTIKTEFAVGATGRTSFAMGSPHPRQHYDALVGVTARFARPDNWSDIDHRPLIESLPDGWCYSVLAPDGHVELAYMTDADIARKKSNSAGSRERMLAVSLGDAPYTLARLNGKLNVTAPVRLVSANSYSRRSVTRTGVILVGDAASAIDPLSGQGSYCSFQDAIRVGEMFETGHRIGREVQEAYEDSRGTRVRHLLADRTAYYRSETRWPRSEFWSRRQASTAP